MSKQYFEDIKLHQKSRSREYKLKEKEIIGFAKKWDPLSFHIDPAFAKNTQFGGLIASGTHLLAICIKLANEKTTLAWIAALGWDKIRFLAPARPGDVLVLENEVIWKRGSKSNANAGIIRFTGKLINQRGEPVLSLEATALLEKRPANGSHSSQSAAR